MMRKHSMSSSITGPFSLTLPAFSPVSLAESQLLLLAPAGDLLGLTRPGSPASRGRGKRQPCTGTYSSRPAAARSSSGWERCLSHR